MSSFLIGKIKSWQYICPLCESHNIYKNLEKEPQAEKYRCECCNSQLTHVYDKKNERKIN